ncbi:MAG: cyclic nucleotide-binding domain-containing protein [Candidatus Margulisiibacteriota bacterium]
MNIIPLISSDDELFTRVTGLIGQSEAQCEEVIAVKEYKEAIDYLSCEMPQLVIISFNDPKIDAFALLDEIMADPWLMHGEIIALCDDYDAAERLEDIKGANIVVTLIGGNIDRYLPRIMSIIQNNQRILFQREIGSDIIDNISGSFRLNNDPVEATCYTNLITNFLYNSNKITDDGKDALNTALKELLLNAIEHGNCGITYQEKTDWLKDNPTILDLIEKKCQDPEVAKKHVLFEYAINPDHSRFFIADEGDGFDWKIMKSKEKEEGELELHGRGIKMTKMFTRNLSYNDKGNEVAFEIEYQRDAAELTPGIFSNMESREVKAGDIVFEQGDRSDYIYYIVKGNYDVIVNGEVIASLSADDIFMGEMSFLLSHRRSAAVKARTKGKLIQISKKAFMQAIRKKPHYALFLARLLAQRVNRSNMKFAEIAGR